MSQQLDGCVGDTEFLVLASIAVSTTKRGITPLMVQGHAAYAAPACRTHVVIKIMHSLDEGKTEV